MTFIPPLEPFVAESMFPEEMARPELRRIHEYFASRDPFGTYQAGRQKSALNDKNFTFGQTPVPVVDCVLRQAGVGAEDTFVDLGSGCGLVTLTAATRVGRAIGVELLPEAVEFANRASEDLEITNAVFRCQDMLETDLSDISVAYVTATAFTPELKEALQERFEQAPAGMQILSTTARFDRGRVELVEQKVFSFSWTAAGFSLPVTLNFHRVLPSG